MGTSLLGTTPQDTYDALIKVGDNGIITGSLKTLSDGEGHDTALALSTGAASVTGTLAVSSDVSIADKIIHTGDTNTAIRFPAADTITFETDAAERMRITSAGNVGIGTSAPAVPLDVVGDIRSSTGILFGSDTAAANALDDYEEGTWTPVINGGGGNPTVTYSAANTGGIYTKIGNQVTISFEVRWTVCSGGSGIVTIAGLPFARRTTAQPDGERLIIDSFDNTISGKYLTGNVGSGNSSIALSMVNSAAAPTDLLISDLIASGLGFLRGTATYFV